MGTARGNHNTPHTLGQTKRIKTMKTQTATQTIYKRFKQFIIMGTVAILGTACGTTTATAPNFETTKWQAKQGNTDAQLKLGDMYEQGDGVIQDFKKALYWWTISAVQGNADAQLKLGEMYHYGQGVTQDYINAVYWYTKASQNGHGHEKAQYYLGRMYHKGDGVIQDYKKALYWWTEASKNGHINAQVYLGLMYEQGQGIPQDYKQAMYWYKRASEQGDAFAWTRMEYLKLKIK